MMPDDQSRADPPRPDHPGIDPALAGKGASRPASSRAAIDARGPGSGRDQPDRSAISNGQGSPQPRGARLDPARDDADPGWVIETVFSPFHCLYQDALFFHTQSRLARSDSEA